MLKSHDILFESSRLVNGLWRMNPCYIFLDLDKIPNNMLGKFLSP